MRREIKDVECPYCDKWQEINHDDGYGYEEDRKHNQRCVDCDRVFVYTTSIRYYYRAEEAPCLNGKIHRMKRVTHSPSNWPDWKVCRYCGLEERGKYVEIGDRA